MLLWVRWGEFTLGGKRPDYLPFCEEMFPNIVMVSDLYWFLFYSTFPSFFVWGCETSDISLFVNMLMFSDYCASAIQGVHLLTYDSSSCGVTVWLIIVSGGTFFQSSFKSPASAPWVQSEHAHSSRVRIEHDTLLYRLWWTSFMWPCNTKKT